LLPIIVDQETHRMLAALSSSSPETTVTVDLSRQTVSLPGGASFRFPVEPFAKACLLNGVDELGYILGHKDTIAAYEALHEH